MNAPTNFKRECCEEGLRTLLRRREELTAELARTNADLSRESRSYADLLGETLLPTVERLRRELLP